MIFATDLKIYPLYHNWCARLFVFTPLYYPTIQLVLPVRTRLKIATIRSSPCFSSRRSFLLSSLCAGKPAKHPPAKSYLSQQPRFLFRLPDRQIVSHICMPGCQLSSPQPSFDPLVGLPARTTASLPVEKLIQIFALLALTFFQSQSCILRSHTDPNRCPHPKTGALPTAIPAETHSANAPSGAVTTEMSNPAQASTPAGDIEVSQQLMRSSDLGPPHIKRTSPERLPQPATNAERSGGTSDGPESLRSPGNASAPSDARERRP